MCDISKRVLSDDGLQWLAGAISSEEYFDRAFKEKRELAREKVRRVRSRRQLIARTP